MTDPMFIYLCLTDHYHGNKTMVRLIDAVKIEADDRDNSTWIVLKGQQYKFHAKESFETVQKTMFETFRAANGLSKISEEVETDHD